MSVLTSVGILVLAVFACAFLQLAPSIFAIFYHYASARNSREKVFDLSSWFMVGAEIMCGTVLFLLYFSTFFFLDDNPGFNLTLPSYIMAGILFALGIFMLCFYYRRRGSTELFVPRKIAKSIALRAKNAKKPSDIIALGMTASLMEFIFTLPVYLVVVVTLINLKCDAIWQPLLLITFIIFNMLPLMLVRSQFHFSRLNLAEIMRSKLKNKNFFRFALTISYMLLAAIIVIAEITK